MHSGDGRKRRLMAWPTGKTETTENTESTEGEAPLGASYPVYPCSIPPPPSLRFSAISARVNSSMLSSFNWHFGVKLWNPVGVRLYE